MAGFLNSGVWRTGFPLLGIAFGIAGIDKLIGMRPYRRLARRWEWRERDMRALGAAELAGGALLANHATRRVGGALLAAASASALFAEARHGEVAEGVPRGVLLALALLAVAAPR